MAGSAIRGTRTSDTLGVEVGGDVVLKEIARGAELVGREVLQALAVLLAVEDELAHHAVCLAEGHALLGQVVSHVGGGGKASLGLRQHDVRVDGHGLQHAGGDLHAVRQRLGRIHRTLLALLEVLVVRQRKRLHRGQKRHEVTVDAAALAARELGEVGVLLLRHDGAAGGVAVRERDEAELGGAPQHDLLAQAREVHHADAARVLKVEQVVTVGDGVQRVGDGVVKAQQLGGALAVKRVGGAGKRRGTQRVGVGGVARGGQALVVAREHPEVRQHVVAEEDRLSVLQVGVARHHHAHVLLGDVEKHTAQGAVALHEVGAQFLGVEADVRRHLVVAAAARVQARARRADVAREGALHGHVDVLVVDVPGKVAVGNLARNVGQAGVDGLLVGLGDDALLGEHLGVGAAAGDVLLCHGLVHLEGRAELLREGVDALLKPATPKSHRALRSSRDCCPS